MPIEVVGAADQSGEYRHAADWHRGVQHLEYVARFGGEPDGCAELANFLDRWEQVNGGPPFVRDGSRRMSSWSTYCGGRERWRVPGVTGERPRPVPEPVDIRDLL